MTTETNSGGVRLTKQDIVQAADQPGAKLREFQCPEEGEAVPVGGGLFCALGRTDDEDEKLMAVISRHPRDDSDVEVLSTCDVESRSEAARWFSQQLTLQPWETRQ